MTKEMRRHYRLLEEAEKLLDPDDPVCAELREASEASEQAYRNTVAIVERAREWKICRN